jgi:protein-disulfide isomerase
MTSMGRRRLLVAVSERDHIKGPASASVTVVGYGDYECPHCGHLYHVLNAVESYMGRRLRLVYRHFPLGVVHPHARLAAEAAEAAAAQGKFWQMHARLFEHQQPLDSSTILACAAALELDMPRFDLELDEHVHDERVWADLMGGVRSGANATPTLFVNGLRHNGSHDLETLILAVEQATRVAAEVPSRDIQNVFVTREKETTS